MLQRSFGGLEMKKFIRRILAKELAQELAIEAANLYHLSWVSTKQSDMDYYADRLDFTCSLRENLMREEALTTDKFSFLEKIVISVIRLFRR